MVHWIGAATGVSTIGMVICGGLCALCEVSFWTSFAAFSAMTMTLTVVLARGHRGREVSDEGASEAT